MEKIKIGNVEFKSRAVLAPMAGITDRATVSFAWNLAPPIA